MLENGIDNPKKDNMTFSKLNEMLFISTDSLNIAVKVQFNGSYNLIYDYDMYIPRERRGGEREREGEDRERKSERRKREGWKEREREIKI